MADLRRGFLLASGGRYLVIGVNLACATVLARLSTPAEFGISVPPHIRTRSYTPRTNGKAGRFIQTSLREGDYAKPYHSSDQRTAAIQPWIDNFNRNSPHAGIGNQSPFSRLNTLLGNDT